MGHCEFFDECGNALSYTCTKGEGEGCGYYRELNKNSKKGGLINLVKTAVKRRIL